jgi:orotidine-5'-phosphate decarboxylase
MDRKALFQQIQHKKSYLCVGLDTDIARIPKHLLKEDDPIFAFNKQIIDATVDFAVAYKPNLAFYEQLGARGWESLAKTIDYLPTEIFTIADAKRGDIGNTSNMYAKAFFEELNFDAITLAPYMGLDSVQPYLAYEGKWSIILALTSNASSRDFEQLLLQDGRRVYEAVLETSRDWGSADQIMYVVGATKAEELGKIRRLVPEHFFLVPGVGAQGGSLEEVSRNGMNEHCGLLVNSSRGIIYASEDEDFADKAREQASIIQQEMAGYLERYCN